jgi:dynein heavy chain
MTVFLDDMSMPFINTWGDQITLEITRQLIEAKGYYFLNKDDRGYFKEVQNLQFMGAMNWPGGGRNDIPPRLKRHFFSINMTPPSVRSIENIYGEILKALFNPKKYNPDIIAMRALLVDATIGIWDATKKRLLPTPAKFHYNFTIRELAGVFQGICGVAAKHEYKVIQNQLNVKTKMRPELFLIALWRHECDRTFVDKLISNGDKKVFSDLLDRVTKEKFRDQLGLDDEQLMTDSYFADFMRKDEVDEYGDITEEAPFVYEACPDLEAIKAIANDKLEQYNVKNQSKPMNLVIFDDALRHLLRITRIINTPGGNVMLVGVGGSGKQSLTKLASFITKKEFFQISLTKTYGDSQLKDDIRELYNKAGPGGKSVSFIMTDAEIKSETFLEALNSMLATGEIPGLIPKEDKDVIALECKTVYAREIGLTKGVDPSNLELWNFFINRVKDQLHTVLCFSPVGNKFRERAQKFPSVFSSCSIDWFLPWPEEALVSVSSKFLSTFKMDCTKDIKAELERHMGKCHDLVTEVCEIYFQRMRRHVYVTPKSYLSFIELYKQVYRKKYDGIDVEESNIVSGLSKLKEATEGVEILKIDLKKEDIMLKEAQEDVEKVLKELEVENRKAKIKSDEVAIVQKNCLEQKTQIEGEKEMADRDLAKAMPFLDRAIMAADSISPKDINELGGMRNAVDTTRLIMDAVQILFQRSMDTIKPKSILMLKTDIPFVFDSFDNHTKKTLTNKDFLKDITDFSNNQKDNITEETIELLEPYLLL